ncbi:MFS transporter [Paraburkholderia sediminicola]|uniref:MFS transporter n=1 Tax=Paraburkholderia sediminicola TaxID=458836 RepID=UPI0038BAA8CE
MSFRIIYGYLRWPPMTDNPTLGGIRSMTSYTRKALSRRKTIVAITVGNALEFFDFTVYGFLALVIGKVFFPTFNSYGQLLLTVASFGVGFVMRPIGAVVIGSYADRAGRKSAMTLTIALMALGCGIIAMTPAYAEIGIAAPLLIVAARLIQGFSAGGEVGASTTMLIEHANPGNRAYMASWQLASQGLGILTGALMVGALEFSLTPQAMESWGWRLPFFLGLLIAPVGAYIRSQLEESLSIESSGPRATKLAQESSLSVLCRQHGKAVLLAMALMSGGTTAAYVVGFYMPTYAIRELGMSPPIALLGAALTGAITFALAPFAGKLADRAGRKPPIVCSYVALAILIYPAFFWLQASPVPAVLFSVVALLNVAGAFGGAPAMTMLPELFPQRVRATGMSLSYGVGVTVFGGFAPFVCTWLVKISGNKMAPAWYLIAMICLSLIGLRYLKDRTGQNIDRAATADSNHSANLPTSETSTWNTLP